MKQEVIRLQKYMSKCGIASRRKSEDIILDGRVKVNEKIVTELGTKIDVYNDVVKVDDKVISEIDKKIYIMLNKPEGYITTADDELGRKNVFDLIPELKKYSLHTVGRLDKDTSGLLILTNDGDFTFKVTHPKHQIKKTYIAVVKGIPDNEKIRQFENGLLIDGYVTSAAELKIVKKMKNSSVLKIIIHEGKKRQVRYMCEKIGHPVTKLKRVQIGNVKLDDLESGKWRHLSKREISSLYK